MPQSAGFLLRDVRPDDHAAVFRLNQSEVPHVGTLTPEKLVALAAQSIRFRVAEAADGRLAGFLIAMDERSTYASPNYLWFRERYPRFVYVDRIAVDPAFRRAGLGRALYADIEAWVRGRAPGVGCEVNLLPPNPGSMAFHARVGFAQVGTQEYEDGAKAVAMLLKPIAE